MVFGGGEVGDDAGHGVGRLGAEKSDFVFVPVDLRIQGFNLSPAARSNRRAAERLKLANRGLKPNVAGCFGVFDLLAQFVFHAPHPTLHPPACNAKMQRL